MCIFGSFVDNATMRTSRISLAVLKQIAERLANCRKDLYALLLVCKDSRSVAETLLYRELELTRDEDMLDMLLETLEDSPRLASLVKRVTCLFPVEGKDEEDSFRFGTPPCRYADDEKEPGHVERIFLACPNLETLNHSLRRRFGPPLYSLTPTCGASYWQKKGMPTALTTCFLHCSQSWRGSQS